MTSDFTKKQRARRIASDEAHAWARSVPLDNPYGKTVLRALTLYVNGEGCCFVGLDQLSDDTDLSVDTVRRRLVWLEKVGAIVRMQQWVDSNGRRNSEAKGKRTTDEIRLLIDADFDEIQRRARGDAGPSEAEEPEISPSTEHEAETVSPALALGQPLQCCDHLISEPEPESPPLPPSGGSVDIEDWKNFEEDWQEPILRQSLAQQVWSALKPDERLLARQAARGYVVWRKAHRKPPNVLGAHLFLRERAAWQKFADQAPGQRQSTGILSDSPEAAAIRALYAVARASPFEHKNRIVYPGEITPQLLAFAEVADRSTWIWIEDRNQLGAWSNFLDAHVRGARPPLLTSPAGSSAPGLNAPWPWPPRKDGSHSTTGPPSPDVPDEDMREFR